MGNVSSLGTLPFKNFITYTGFWAYNLVLFYVDGLFEYNSSYFRANKALSTLRVTKAFGNILSMAISGLMDNLSFILFYILYNLNNLQENRINFQTDTGL
jgi:hypothetical protein